MGIFSYLVKDNKDRNKYNIILIHEKIILPVPHKEKCLENIASEIDKMIKTYYTKIDAIVDKSEVKIEENYKTACSKLITEWFKIHKKEKVKFEFVNSHILEICIKIILEGKFKEQIDDLIIHGNLEKLFLLLEQAGKTSDDIKEDKKINNNNDNKNNIITKTENDDFKPTNFYFNENPVIRCPSPKKSLSFTSNNENTFNYNNSNSIDKKLKNYYLAQAYVFEDLTKLNLFDKIDWKNQVNDNEEGDEVTLFNSNKYKIKKSNSPVDFVLKSKQNKILNLIVLVVNDKRYNYIKLKSTIKQWKLFINEDKEQDISIFALVYFHFYESPQIYYIKKCNLDEIFK